MASDNPLADVLVTGAAGKTGRTILRALGAEGLSVRALVRGPAQRAVVEALGVDQIAEGDLLDDHSIQAAAQSVDAVYHICPNVHPDEADIGRRVIAAARQAGARRFVFHSVLHPQCEAMPHHWAKLRVEELLFESGLPFTILQPAPYMQNILGQWENITTQGLFSVPYRLATRIAMVDLDDVAVVAARVLSQTGHLGATYELCGPDLLDQTEIATLLSHHLGRTVHAKTVTLEEWAASAGCAPESYRFETLVRMFRYYERHGMAGNPLVLAGLLERPPTDISRFIERHSADPLNGQQC